MEGANHGVVGSTGPVSAKAVPVLKPDVVDEVLARLGRGEPVKRLTEEFDIDRTTVRAWRARGRYQPRALRARKSILDPHAAWLTGRAPELDFNSAALFRELVTHFGYAGSEQQLLRASCGRSGWRLADPGRPCVSSRRCHWHSRIR
jgi:hypothetical protein